MNRLDGAFDVQLHLVDRQVVDSDGLMVCKADDVEVQELDGALVLTGILVGVPVWVPRISAWLGERWRRLGHAQADRERPYRLAWSDVAEVSQEIRLLAGREGVLRRQSVAEDPGGRHRLQDLLGARVLHADGRDLGRVIDVRAEPGPGAAVPRVTTLVVGRGRPGSLLGYDRRGDQGPWLVNRVVRRLHRHTGALPVDCVESIDWSGGIVQARGELAPLRPVDTWGSPQRDR